MDGTKTVELRRGPVSTAVSHVVVYATSPVKTVLGWFEVASIERDRPSRLWRRHSHATGVSAAEFRTYFEGAEQGTAISVRRAFPLERPIDLTTFGTSLPPQSFRYIDSSVADRVLGLGVSSAGRSHRRDFVMRGSRARKASASGSASK
jgi:predicted transcriptional regulator